jgi:hypothetical protein
VLRPGEQGRGLGELDDAAEIHDGDTGGDVLDDRKIVADEHVGELELAAQVHEQVEDLRLNRDVEGGGWLVADHDLGPHHKGAGDGNALALAARQFARIAVGETGRQPDALQHLDNRAPPLRGGSYTVHLQGKRDDGGDAAARIERGVGVLEDRLDAAGHSAAVEDLEVGTVDLDAPGARRQETEHQAR